MRTKTTIANARAEEARMDQQARVHEGAEQLGQTYAATFPRHELLPALGAAGTAILLRLFAGALQPTPKE